MKCINPNPNIQRVPSQRSGTKRSPSPNLLQKIIFALRFSFPKTPLEKNRGIIRLLFFS